MTAEEYHRASCLKEIAMELSFSLEESAFVMLHTSAPSHVFVSMLNHLYGWHLHRYMRSDKNRRDYNVQDFGGSSTQLCPLYLYSSAISHSLYILISNPTCDIDASLKSNQYDKILILQGGDAFTKQEKIFHDLTDKSHYEVGNGDYLGCRREVLRYYMSTQLVNSGDYFDFSRCADTSTERNENIISAVDNTALNANKKIAKKSPALYANAGLKEDYQKEKQSVYQMSLFDNPNDVGSKVAGIHKQNELPKTSMLDDVPSGMVDMRHRQLLLKLQTTSKKILDALWVEICK
jgi:hypothetical protein